jgi:hypothetical protein
MANFRTIAVNHNNLVNSVQAATYLSIDKLDTPPEVSDLRVETIDFIKRDLKELAAVLRPRATIYGEVISDFMCRRQDFSYIDVISTVPFEEIPLSGFKCVGGVSGDDIEFRLLTKNRSCGAVFKYQLRISYGAVTEIKPKVDIDSLYMVDDGVKSFHGSVIEIVQRVHEKVALPVCDVHKLLVSDLYSLATDLKVRGYTLVIPPAK